MAAILRDGDRVLLCHRSPTRRWYPDVWDLPGGHIEDGETPADALARELHEELAITVPPPPGPPFAEFHAATFTMQVWLLDTWTGTPINAAPTEHDAVAWFTPPELDALPLAHESYPTFLTSAVTR